MGLQFLWQSAKREGFLSIREEGGIVYEKAKPGMKNATLR